MQIFVPKRQVDPKVFTPNADGVGLSSYLALVTVSYGERAAGRLVVSHGAVSKLSALAASMALRVFSPCISVIRRRNLVAGTDHAASFVPGIVPKADRLLYFSQNMDWAKAAAEIEIAGNHQLLGELFGYPQCCRAFFEKLPTSNFDKLPASMDSFGPFQGLMNPLVPLVYKTPGLLFHFTCSPTCKHSISLATSRKRFLEHFLGNGYVAPSGKGIALYGPKLGIGIVTNYEQIEDSKYRVVEVATRSPTTKRLFAERNSELINVADSRNFSIGDRAFCDDLNFVGMYS